jgi:hypothetical protein
VVWAMLHFKLPVTEIPIQPQRHGHVEVKLAPSACSHRWGFRRTCGSDSWGSSEGLKELFQFCGFEEERSCVDLGPRVGGLQNLEMDLELAEIRERMEELALRV